MSAHSVHHAPVSTAAQNGRLQPSTEQVDQTNKFVQDIAKQILSLQHSRDSSPQAITESLALIIKPFFPENPQTKQVDRITSLIRCILQKKGSDYGLFRFVHTNRDPEIVVNPWALTVLAAPSRFVSDVFTLIEHVPSPEEKCASRIQDQGDTKSQVLSNPGIEGVQSKFKRLGGFWREQLMEEVFIPLAMKKWFRWQNHSVFETKLKGINPFILYLKSVSNMAYKIVKEKFRYEEKQHDFDDFDPKYLPLLLGYLLSWKELDFSFSNLSTHPKLEGFYQTLPYFYGLSSLDLGYNGLRSVPEVLGSLGNLAVLKVNNNAIPSLPESFKNLGKLRVLNLDGNCFQKLPLEIFACKGLNTLSANKNKISSIPKEIKHLTSLRHLELSENALRSLPEELKTMGLKTLALKNNKLRSAPIIIGLRALYISGNNIPSVPRELLSTTKVRFGEDASLLSGSMQKIVLHEKKKLDRRNARSHERARSWASSAKSEGKKKPSPRRQRGKSPGRSSSARSKSSSESRYRRSRRTQSTTASALRHQRSDSFRRSSAGRSNNSSLATPVPRSRRTQSASTSSPRRPYDLQNRQTIKRAQSTTRMLRRKQ
ncbi:MAG: leucine-rich repeat domain-containing protein [Chlamydiota bacterium]